MDAQPAFTNQANRSISKQLYSESRIDRGTACGVCAAAKQQSDVCVCLRAPRFGSTICVDVMLLVASVADAFPRLAAAHGKQGARSRNLQQGSGASLPPLLCPLWPWLSQMLTGCIGRLD